MGKERRTEESRVEMSVAGSRSQRRPSSARLLVAAAAVLIAGGVVVGMGAASAHTPDDVVGEAPAPDPGPVEAVLDGPVRVVSGQPAAPQAGAPMSQAPR